MFEPLFITDMVLALAAMITALVLAGRASDDARRRRWLRITAALVAARVVATGLILTGGLALADTRLYVQLPLAILPIAVALWKPGPTTAHVGAAGVLLSGWWLFTPFGLQDTALVLAGSAATLVVVAGLSIAVGRWRRSGTRASRAPWLATTLLLVPAVVLVVDFQANAVPNEHHHASGGVGVDQLTGPRDGTPDVRLTLTAAHGEVRLASGKTVDALTFNGVSPGPEIRAKKGQLVEVTLVNTDVEEGVTVHWHGVDVPNAEDGVPGVTQNAVLPGERHVYRFVPNRAGTFWYHTHRDALHTVQKGLFGSLVIEDGKVFDGIERTVFAHRWPGERNPVTAFDRADQPTRHAAEPGRNVLLRLVNSSGEPQRVHVGGTRFTVAAIDGNEVRGATPIEPGTVLLLAAGGRYDVAFTMPDGTVTVALAEAPDSAALAYSPSGTADPVATTDGGLFDPLAYGSGSDTAPDAFDRTFDLRLDDGFGFSQGRFGYVSSLINGRLFPAVPTLQVAEGDRVKVRIANRSLIDHPLHLHGHRVRVLSRNGVPATGSSWWTDTLNAAPGQVYEIAFTADNPGIWMDHCHNFEHGADGMIMHLAYDGVSSPYSAAHSPE